MRPGASRILWFTSQIQEVEVTMISPYLFQALDQGSLLYFVSSYQFR